MLKLDIGSGDFPYGDNGGGPGWTTVDAFHAADVKADMASLPFADGSVDEIWSSHSLEHLDHEHALRALSEWHRVLKPDGRLTLTIPNMDWIVRHWAENPNHPNARAFLFGLQRDSGDQHRTGWNEKGIARDLNAAGFRVDNISFPWSHSQQGIRVEAARVENSISQDDLTRETYKNAGDRVLVACPTYRGKAYALDAYLGAYNNFTYPHRGMFMVDNTGIGLDYFRHLQSCNVPCEHIDPSVDFQETFARSWKRIVNYAAEHGYQWIASIEQDNICPPLTLDALLNVAGYCRAVHVAHSYPWHKNQASQGRLIGLGCNLISVEMLVAIFAQEKWFTNAVESEIFEYPKLMGYPTVELHNLVTVEHLDDPTKATEFFHFRRDALPKMGAAAMEATPIKYAKNVTPLRTQEPA